MAACAILSLGSAGILAFVLRRLALLLAIFVPACASQRSPADPGSSPKPPLSASPSRPEQPVEADEYTRYELLAPETASFHILYEVTAISPGATFFFNPIRKGSVASGERVFDRMSGDALTFDVVSGEQARRSGLADVDAGTDYIRIRLPRPVPPDGGQVRLLIEKTYQDPKSYFVEAGTIVFTRSLGIRHNSVLLPAGYELIQCNVPSQVLSEADGRILVSFVNPGPGPAPLTIKARRLPS